MKTVVLQGTVGAGRVALVDDEDWDLACRYRWHASRRTLSNGQARYYARNTDLVYMHKVITGWALTDHKDHDGLNNQRCNLRDATNSQNGANELPGAGGTSLYKGVSWYALSRKWRATIRVNFKQQSLGLFASEGEAACAYDAAAAAAWGEFALLNFPDGA